MAVSLLFFTLPTTSMRCKPLRPIELIIWLNRSPHFLRIHRACIINTKYVAEIEPYFNSLGIPSRLEYGSNGFVPQFYFKKEWRDVWFAGRNQPPSGKGFIRFSFSEKNPIPKYYTNFTIAYFENGHYNTLRNSIDFKEEIALAPGHYMLVTGNRVNENKILSTLSFFELKENEHKAIDIKLRKEGM